MRKSDTAYFARLAKLELSCEELEEFAGFINEFAEFAECLDALASDENDLSYISENGGMRLRDDKAELSDGHGLLLLSECVYGDYYRVPQTVDNGGEQ